MEARLAFLERIISPSPIPSHTLIPSQPSKSVRALLLDAKETFHQLCKEHKDLLFFFQEYDDLQSFTAAAQPPIMEELVTISIPNLVSLIEQLGQLKELMQYADCDFATLHQKIKQFHDSFDPDVKRLVEENATDYADILAYYCEKMSQVSNLLIRYNSKLEDQNF